MHNNLLFIIGRFPLFQHTITKVEISTTCFDFDSESIETSINTDTGRASYMEGPGEARLCNSHSLSHSVHCFVSPSFLLMLLLHHAQDLCPAIRLNEHAQKKMCLKVEE